MELTTHPSVYLSVSLPPSFHPMCMEFLLRSRLFYGLKIRHVGEREAEVGHKQEKQQVQDLDGGKGLEDLTQHCRQKQRSQPLCATQNETALPLILIWLVNSIKMWGLGGRGWGESFSQLSFFSSFDLDRVQTWVVKLGFPPCTGDR